MENTIPHTNSTSDEISNPVKDWAQRNPWLAFIAFLVGTFIFSATSSLITTKTVAKQDTPPPINTENFATKQDKEEIWRFMNQNFQQQNGQILDIRQNMATKSDFQILDKKTDSQINMLSDQNKLLQEFIQMSR